MAAKARCMALVWYGTSLAPLGLWGQAADRCKLGWLQPLAQEPASIVSP